MKSVLLAAAAFAYGVEAQTCQAGVAVGFCPFRGCFAFLHGPAYCHHFHCYCNHGYCSVDGKRCVLDNSTSKVSSATTSTTTKPREQHVSSKANRAMLVIGTDPSLPLYADAVFKARLEHHGFDVTLIKDSMATDNICEQFGIMLVSASIDGNVVKHRLDKCSTPSMHWEMGLWLFNGMTGPTMGIDAWLTHENRFARVPKGPSGAWPPRPQAGNILMTEEGAEPGALGADLGPGVIPFFKDGFYGMNWASVDSLGSGAKVAAVLPMPTAPKPATKKAVLFYYQKGAPLYGNRGPSPSLRIGFTPFHYSHGTDPTCEELTEAQKTCNGCSTCEPTAKMESSVEPMPLTKEGLRILDNCIRMLKEAAQQEHLMQHVNI